MTKSAASAIPVFRTEPPNKPPHHPALFTIVKLLAIQAAREAGDATGKPAGETIKRILHVFIPVACAALLH